MKSEERNIVVTALKDIRDTVYDTRHHRTAGKVFRSAKSALEALGEYEAPVVGKPHKNAVYGKS